MPSRVSDRSWDTMEKDHPSRLRQAMSSLPTSLEENNTLPSESNFNSTPRQNTRSLQSPPPLIPNSVYSNEKISLTSNENNQGSAFMMQFMTAAAAAAMVAASKKAETQGRRTEPYFNSRISDNVTHFGRRPSSNLSSVQNISPSSTPSSIRSLSAAEGGRCCSTSRSDTLNTVTDIQKSNSNRLLEENTKDDDINIVHDDMNKKSARRSGSSLPLPPGAVPVGTLPHPSDRDSISQTIFGLFKQLFNVI